MDTKDKSLLQTAMDELQAEAIKGLLEKLRQKSCPECGARSASAQDFANALKLLKDNGFQIEPSKGSSELQKIIGHLEGHGKYPDSTIPS